MLEAILAVLAAFSIATASPTVHGQATWIHQSLDGGTMRNSETYHMEDPTVIAVGVDEYGDPIVPLGKTILVCTPVKCLVGIGQDTGYFDINNVDISPAAMAYLSNMSVEDVLEEGGRVLDVSWVVLN